MQKVFDEYCDKCNIVEIIRIFNEDKNIDIYDSFYNACIIWLYSIENPNINAIYDAFINACGSGHLNIAKILCKLNEHICTVCFNWIFNYFTV
jgi:hypothetical protein